MGSMNWLGFSLSPHDQLSSQSSADHQSQNAVVSSDCFDSCAPSPSLNLPPPSNFSILDSFHRSHHPSQDWNMKGLEMNSESDYKRNASELSMLMGTSCSNQNMIDSHNHQPKLENFLGGRHSFTDHDNNSTAYTTVPDYIFPSGGDSSCDAGGGGCAHHDNTNPNPNPNISNSSIGLSMIKTWLRNQPTTSPPDVTDGDHGSRTTITNAQTLSLSMSTGSQSSSALPLMAATGEGCSSDNNKQQVAKVTSGVESQTGCLESVPRKSIDTFGQRTSIYRGVTRHRWTGRYEAHLWDNSCRREGQTRKGRQVYLGGYDKEEKAARAYDLAALKYWGTTTTTNFPINNYEKEVEEMKHMTRQEYVASLRRKSSGFSRGASIYRGVTRHHQHGRWQARIGRVAGNKDLYLGTFSTQEEAAEAYDIAAIKFRGLNAVTNFDMSRYDVKSILESSTLPIGGAAKRLKDVEQAEIIIDGQRPDDESVSQLTDGINSYGSTWPSLAFQQPQQSYNLHYPYGQRIWCKQEQPDSDAPHNYQLHDHHQLLQLGNTHNFFQHNNPSFHHNLIGIDSASMEHSSAGSNSIVYGGDGSGYLIPMGIMGGGDHNNQSQGNNGMGGESENVYGSSSMDPYQARNLYYLSQQASSTGNNHAVNKVSPYDHGSTCNNWNNIPTAVPTGLAPRSANMTAVCHATPTFTIWNDT